MPLIIPSNSITGGYEVDNSLRFDRASSDYLSKTYGSAGNRKTMTFSFWIKRSNLSTNQYPMSIFDSGSGNQADMRFASTTDVFRMYATGTDATPRVHLVTNRVFRDISAWYHIVWEIDTTQVTASDRVKLYVNGVQETSFSTETYPAQNIDLRWNGTSGSTGGVTNIGAINGGNSIDGYMAEVCFIDGTALDPTSFGEFDADTGIWKPIDVSGLTFGTNGFYLDFESSGSLGNDVSGNGNNFTVNNLTSDDQMIDTPTNNFCTLNPLFRGGEVGETLEEGNLFYDSGDDRENFVCATQSVSTGKWYFEVLPSSTDTHGAYGFTNADNLLQTTSASTSPYDLGIGGMIRPDGNGTPDYKINSTSTTISVTTTSVFGIALDADTGDIEFFENNVSVGSGTITGITNYIPFANCHSSSAGRRGIATFNFGQDSSFAGSKTRQNNTDNNGQGDFYYAPPTGYYALNTTNLAEYG